MTDDQMRKAFEAWWKSRKPAASIKDDAFAAYQAGRALLSGYDELREDWDALRTRMNVLHRVIRSHERAAAHRFAESGNAYDEGRRVAYDQCCAEIRAAIDAAMEYARRTEGEGK